MAEQVVQMNWDWKGQPEMGELRGLGLHVYADPFVEGSDQMGYLVSTVPMTRERYAEWLRSKFEWLDLDEGEFEELVAGFDLSEIDEC